MPDRRNPHNAYYYQQPGQASPIYIPPSKSTQRILPVPQKPGQGDYHYGMPGQAAPVYVPGAKKRMAKNYVKSDERSKTEIRKLEEKNAALTAALDGATTESNMPPTEYPKLPSHTRFAPDPADTVAAQNVAMAPPPAPVPVQAPPPMPPRPAAPAWNPTAGAAPPDLSALDEAYRRIGATQGG